MKKITVLLVVLMMVTTLFVGCAKEAPAEEVVEKVTEEVAEEPAEEVKEITIGVAHKNSSSPFWVTFQDGVKAAEAEFGIKVDMQGPAIENDPAGQLAIVENFITQEYDGIVVAPCDDVGIAPAVQTALDSGIPVVAADNGVTGADVSMVATDNANAAALGAKYIGDTLEGKGNILMVNGIISQGSGKGRYEGFKNYIEANYPDMVILTPIEADWDDQKALAGVEDAVNSGQQIDAVFAAWDGGALQAHSVFKAEGMLDDVVICGFDLFDATKVLMAAGEFEADVVQDPFNMGYLGVKTVLEQIDGQTHDAFIDTGAKLATIDNLADFE